MQVGCADVPYPHGGGLIRSEGSEGVLGLVIRKAKSLSGNRPCCVLHSI